LYIRIYVLFLGSCNSSDFSYGDKCYVKTSYNGKDNRIDWFNGQTYCNNNNIQVVIVYSYLDDDTITDSIINLVEDSAECVQLWFGVRKGVWFWKRDISYNLPHTNYI